MVYENQCCGKKVKIQQIKLPWYLSLNLKVINPKITFYYFNCSKKLEVYKQWGTTGKKPQLVIFKKVVLASVCCHPSSP